MGRTSPRLRRLATEVARRYPQLSDPDAVIAAGEILVAGFPRTNPASLVGAGESISLRRARPLRGTVKLAHALRAFEISPRGRVALDLGAAAGGFTQALLDAGAARVYAVDAGHGQLRGRLRQDPRVVNLEATNLALLDTALVPQTVELVTMDLSYLTIAAAVPQLEALSLHPEADLIALVKPAFELRLPSPPAEGAKIAAALTHAATGLCADDWNVTAAQLSPVLGSRGAVEWLLHARRAASR